MCGSDEWNVRGRNAIVTGGTAGIGFATALGLARAGANVVLTGRTTARCEAALKAIREQLTAEGADAGQVAFLPLDLGDFGSIMRFATAAREHFDGLHVLVHNAGFVCRERGETRDGFEAMFGVNHMGPFTLTRLVRDWLVMNAPARIVVVSSEAHRGVRGMDFDDLQMKQSFASWKGYCRSKLANILFTRALARRLAGTGVTANCLHPGVIASEFGQDAGPVIKAFFKYGRPLLKSSERGARTSLHVALAPELRGVSGEYFSSSRPKRPSTAARDDAAAETLWEVSDALAAGSSLKGF